MRQQQQGLMESARTDAAPCTPELRQRKNSPAPAPMTPPMRQHKDGCYTDNALTAIITEEPNSISVKVLTLAGSERAAYTFEAGATVSDLVAKVEDRWGATTFKNDDDVRIDDGDALGLWKRITIIVTQAFKFLSGLTSYSLEFENVECFKRWLATSKSTRHFLRGRSSWDPSPGSGLIVDIAIAPHLSSPHPSLPRLIGSVAWVHWGDGSVRVGTMSDDVPTMHPGLDQQRERDSYQQSEIRRQHMMQCVHLMLTMQSIRMMHRMSADCSNMIVGYLIPKVFIRKFLGTLSHSGT